MQEHCSICSGIVNAGLLNSDVLPAWPWVSVKLLQAMWTARGCRITFGLPAPSLHVRGQACSGSPGSGIGNCPEAPDCSPPALAPECQLQWGRQGRQEDRTPRTCRADFDGLLKNRDCVVSLCLGPHEVPQHGRKATNAKTTTAL